MKKTIIVLAIALAAVSFYSFNHLNKPIAANEMEYLMVTTIESVVPGGLGRSRMITATESGTLDEIKMENFFSMVGINFENVRSNDRLITDKISDLTKQGWQIANINSGVYSADKSTGIFITRYLFNRAKK